MLLKIHESNNSHVTKKSCIGLLHCAEKIDYSDKVAARKLSRIFTLGHGDCTNICHQCTSWLKQSQDGAREDVVSPNVMAEK